MTNRDLRPLPLNGDAVGSSLSSSVTDVLTIGDEATVFRPIQRVLRSTGWAVAHAGDIDSALAFLRSNAVAAAVFEAPPDNDAWRGAISRMRGVAQAPEVIVLAADELAVDQAAALGAHDVLRRPFNQADVLWSIATAWHNWMKQHETRYGEKPCSGA